MKRNKRNPPITVLYRGTLKDTAALIGLVHTGANIGVIAFTNELNDKVQTYLKELNLWLNKRGVCQVQIHPELSGKQFDSIIQCPLKNWGWGESECKAALNLACLAMPPMPTAA